MVKVSTSIVTPLYLASLHMARYQRKNWERLHLKGKVDCYLYARTNGLKENFLEFESKEYFVNALQVDPRVFFA